jgi:hypothetical protein
LFTPATFGAPPKELTIDSEAFTIGQAARLQVAAVIANLILIRFMFLILLN